MDIYLIELIYGWMEKNTNFSSDHPIEKEDEIIQEGIRLTMRFKDVKQGYYVRKTYVMENNLWYHEELYAVPLTKF